MKNKWSKTDEKTRFGGTLGFFLSSTTLVKVEPPPPPSLKIVPAPLHSSPI